MFIILTSFIPIESSQVGDIIVLKTIKPKIIIRPPMIILFELVILIKIYFKIIKVSVRLWKKSKA